MAYVVFYWQAPEGEEPPVIAKLSLVPGRCCKKNASF